MYIKNPDQVSAEIFKKITCDFDLQGYGDREVMFKWS